MNLAAQTRFPRSAQMILLIAIILIAIVFRFAQFGQTPPGLHYDEAIDAKLAQDIRAGKWAIYFEEGWGREPLYHTLVALTLNFVSDPTSALRLVSAVLGLAQLLAAYFLFRRLFGVPTALIAAAWIAVMFWTVSTSRAGLRNITLTTLATLTAWAFWRAWSATQEAGSERQAQPPISFFILHPSSFIPHPSSPALATQWRGFLLPGILLGLTLYTYQPSRVVPIIYLVFIAYLSFTHRSSLTSNWKPLVVFLAIAVVVFVPLAIFLATHPGAETGRAFQTEPIRALLQGNPGPALHTATATLKMFTFEGGGDPQPIYNVPGRPLFIGLGSILFYIGLLACLVRWRQPAYAFVLIWLIVTLLPNLLTEPAPFFYRAIAAQTPTLALPAIGTVALSDWFNRTGREERKEKEQENARRCLRSSRFIVLVAVAAISLGQTAWTTQHDYFEVWGKNSEVRFQYSAAHTAIARALDASNDASPVAISGAFTEDADPYIFTQTLHRRDLSIRWFDAREALVVSGAGGDQRIALPSFTPPDATLQSRFLRQAALIAQTQDFVLFSFDASAFTADIERWGGMVQTPGLPASSLPISFDGNLLLLGYEKPATISRAESTLTLLTAWHVTSEWQPSSTAIFAHLIDANGQLTAQDDRLGFPRHNWRPGDEFVQVQRIPIGAVAPGRYTLQIGVYTRADDRRWIARDGSGIEIGDRVLLGQVEVRP